MNFEQEIQNWLSVDNQLKILNEKIKILRNKKTEITSNINNYVNDNNLYNNTIKINDERIKFGSTKVQSPLTFRYLEKTLNEIIKNENQVKQIIEYVKNKREINIVPEIKRYSNN